MTAVWFIAIVFGGIVLSLAMVGGTILMAIRLRHGGVSRSAQQLQAEEAGMIQEIYHGLNRLEERLEALETLLMDEKRKDLEK